MGYRPDETVYKLKFADGQFDGLVVKARSTSFGAYLDLAGLLNADTGDDELAELKRQTQMIESFAAALVEWNVEDRDGKPVPATLDGLRSQSIDFVLYLFKAWFEVLGELDGPLSTGSSNGGRSPVPPLPMEERSPSPTS